MAIPALHAADPVRFDPLELYASGIDQSDYAARVARVIAAGTLPANDLLDVGAGGGQLGSALRGLGLNRWIALEPAPSMRARLRRLRRVPDRLIATGWEAVRGTDPRCDLVLAANVAAPLTQTQRFLDFSRAHARRDVVWVVPAQAGPRGLCLAGCLPQAWHGEDETPGVDLVLASLPETDRPHSIDCIDWTFRLCVDDLPALAHYLADRLDWPRRDGRRRELLSHLAAQGRAIPEGVELSVAKRSAILHWRLA